MTLTNNINIAWLKNTKTQEDKKQITLSVYNYLRDPITKRLVSILQDKKEALLTLERSKEKYKNNSSWSYEQAHINGNLEVLDQILNLLMNKE